MLKFLLCHILLNKDTEKEQVACVEDVVASLPASSGEGDMKTLENDEDEKDVGELSVMTTDKAVVPTYKH